MPGPAAFRVQEVQSGDRELPQGGRAASEGQLHRTCADLVGEYRQELRAGQVLYPPGPVTPGGITDRMLSDYPNVWGDMSAGSGLNSMTRDEDHAREFLKRHQDRLLFGSDCSDRQAGSPTCLGVKIIAAIRRLSPDKKVERKILYENASKLFKITLAAPSDRCRASPQWSPGSSARLEPVSRRALCPFRPFSITAATDDLLVTRR